MLSLGFLGKLFILLGVFIILIGLFLLLGERIPWLGRLPGDFVIRKKSFTFYFPLATSIIISIILTLIFTFLSRR